MTAEDIDLSDCPELTPEWFATAVVRDGLKPRTPKVQLTLRLEPDVLEWFRGRGPGYQTEMTAVLRAYKEAHVEAAAHKPE